MFICLKCGLYWTREEFEREQLAAFPLDDLLPGLDDGWCPSCGFDGDVEEE